MCARGMECWVSADSTPLGRSQPTFRPPCQSLDPKKAIHKGVQLDDPLIPSHHHPSPHEFQMYGRHAESSMNGAHETRFDMICRALKPAAPPTMYKLSLFKPSLVISERRDRQGFRTEESNNKASRRTNKILH